MVFMLNDRRDFCSSFNDKITDLYPLNKWRYMSKSSMEMNSQFSWGNWKVTLNNVDDLFLK